MKDFSPDKRLQAMKQAQTLALYRRALVLLHLWVEPLTSVVLENQLSGSFPQTSPDCAHLNSIGQTAAENAVRHYCDVSLRRVMRRERAQQQTVRLTILRLNSEWCPQSGSNEYAATFNERLTTCYTLPSNPNVQMQHSYFTPRGGLEAEVLAQVCHCGDG